MGVGTQRARTPVIMEFSTLCDLGLPVPADLSSPISPALDQLRPHPKAEESKVPGLLERLTQVPNPRDPRGVRHPLVTVLTLTACAVPAGTRSLLAVGEYVADTPPALLKRLGGLVGPLFPRRSLAYTVHDPAAAGPSRRGRPGRTGLPGPGSRTGRPGTMGCGRRPSTESLRGMRPAPTGEKSICRPPATT